MYTSVMATVRTTTEARASLPEILDLVEAGDEVMLTRHGKPVAVIVRPDALRSRRVEPATLALSQRVSGMLETARDRPLSRRGHISRQRADERVAELDRERSPR